MSIFDQLLEMGFNEVRARKAVKATQANNNISAAMDWLIKHQDDPDIDDPPEMDQENQSSVDISIDNKVPEAKSLKCDQCGKTFREVSDAEFHAAKSGHDQFSESTEEVKALSEEEREAKLQELNEKLRLKKAKEADEEKKQAIEMEKKRRAMGHDMLTAKQRIEEQEMKKLVEDRKKQKKEDMITKQRVLEQIKLDREAKAAGVKLDKYSQPAFVVDSASAKPKHKEEPAASEAKKLDYTECKMQLRLTDGSTLTHTFSANEPLAAVRLFVQLNRKDKSADAPFRLMTTYPRKVFDEESMQTPLNQLGLVPSAVLIVTQAAVPATTA